MENISKNEEKIDINSLSLNEVNEMSKKIGDELRDICDEAANKANALLQKYGMHCKIAISINEIPKKMIKPMGVKKKKLKPV